MVDRQNRTNHGKFSPSTASSFSFSSIFLISFPIDFSFLAVEPAAEVKNRKIAQALAPRLGLKEGFLVDGSSCTGPGRFDGKQVAKSWVA